MKKRFTLLLVLAATFLMFMPVKVYAEPNPDSTEWAMLKKAVEFEIDDSLAEVFELTITDGNTRTIKLLKNITAEEDDSVMTVPNGKTVTLNLNGFTLDRGLSEASEPVENGHLLDVDGGVLNITGKGKIRGGNEFYDGGAIYNAGTLNISGEITICDNKARRYGGAIYNVGNLNIGVGTTICDNEAHDGGAICNDMGGRVEAMASTFDNNTCDGCGGAIYNTDLVEVNYVNLVNCNLSNNRAQSGGAIYTKDIVKFTGTDFLWGTIGIIDSCTANEYGGAVYINGDGRFEMSGGKITNCSAKSGGAIYVSNGAEILRGTAQLTNLTIEDCEATENDGGGILSHGAIGLDGVTVSGNRAKKNGGGICLDEKGSIFLGTNTNIIGNINTVSECDNNLYLDDNLLMVKFGTGEDVKAPSSEMKIGVTKKTGPVSKKPVDLIGSAEASYKDYIVSDDSNYVVKFKGDKLILAMNHTHDFEFTSEDNRILATCKGPCEDFYDDKPYTLTLTPSSALEYDGQEKTISFADGEEQAWSTAGFDVPEISYYKKSASGESYDKIDSTPVEAGIYQAKIDVESKTALYDFEIQKKKITVKITPNGGEYKKTITPATAVFEGLVNGDDIKPVLTYTSKNYDSTEVPTEAGTYTVTASLPKEASNYELTGKVTAEFVISGGAYEDPTIRFKDVKPGKWYSKIDGPIAYVAANEIMNGTGDGTTFEPDAPCTREMFVQILYNIEGRPAVTGTNPFKDVKNKWYYDAITWAVNNGVTNGKSAHTFGVGENVSREQLAQFLMNYAKKRGYDISAKADLGKFSDAKEVSGWAKDALSWANANGIVNGKAKDGKNYLAPTDNATRAECAMMLMNFQKKFEK